MALHLSTLAKAWGGIALLGLILGPGCATRPPAPSPGTSTLAGHLEVRSPIPTAGGSGAGAYGDRRLRDAAQVDYTRPGFAVVYLESDDARIGDSTEPPQSLHITLSDGTARLRADPAEAALRVGSRLSVHNDSDTAHVVSLPDLGRVESLEPGDDIEFEVDRAGEIFVHVLDRPGTSARLFVAPGPFVRVPDSGRFVLVGLEPGSHRLHVWHSRLPPTSQVVVLRPDRIENVELALGGIELPGD